MDAASIAAAALGRVSTLRAGTGANAAPLQLFHLISTDDDVTSGVTPILASSRARAVRHIIRHCLVPKEVLLGVGVYLAQFQEEAGAPPPADGLTEEQQREYLQQMSENLFDQRLEASSLMHCNENEAMMYSLDGPISHVVVADESEDGAVQQLEDPSLVEARRAYQMTAAQSAVNDNSTGGGASAP